MKNAKKKVLLIAGPGRSGSTLVELILGNQDGYFSVGEARYFWEYIHHGWGICGCGKALENCEYWKGIMQRVTGEEGCDVRQLSVLSERINRTALIPLLQWTPFLVQRETRKLSAAFRVLYREIIQSTTEPVIVDSSKIGSYLNFLLHIPDIDLRVLHLVRDSRAVAYAWKYRQKDDPSRQERGGVMKERGLLRSSLAWLITNQYVSKAGPKANAYSVLRYEDFVKNPTGEINRALVELELPTITADLSGEFDLLPTHSLGGNPIRFKSGPFSIQDKSAWKTNLSCPLKVGLGILTFPMLKRFNYPLTDGGCP